MLVNMNWRSGMIRREMLSKGIIESDPHAPSPPPRPPSTIARFQILRANETTRMIQMPSTWTSGTSVPTNSPGSTTPVTPPMSFVPTPMPDAWTHSFTGLPVVRPSARPNAVPLPPRATPRVPEALPVIHLQSSPGSVAGPTPIPPSISGLTSVQGQASTPTARPGTFPPASGLSTFVQSPHISLEALAITPQLPSTPTPAALPVLVRLPARSSPQTGPLPSGGVGAHTGPSSHVPIPSEAASAPPSSMHIATFVSQQAARQSQQTQQARPRRLRHAQRQQRQRGRSNYVHVFLLGEPIERFVGRKLVELPTPLLGTSRLEISIPNDPNAPDRTVYLSALLICYGRRLFIAAKSANDSMDESSGQCVICTGQTNTIPLPPFLNYSVAPRVVEDHRVGQRSVDPSIHLLFGGNDLHGPVVEAVEPNWHGLLSFQNGSSDVVIRASGVRLSYPRQKAIEELHKFPQMMKFSEEQRVPTAEILDKIGVPEAEWLGVFITTDERGFAGTNVELKRLQHAMITEKYGYKVTLTHRPGSLFLWCMHINRRSCPNLYFVFSIMQTTPSSPAAGWVAGMTNWQGRLVINEQDFDVAALEMGVPGRERLDMGDFPGVLRFERGDQIGLRGYLNVLRSEFSRWAVRFVWCGRDPGYGEMRLRMLACCMSERNVLVRCRVHGGVFAVFGTALQGTAALIGVFVDYRAMPGPSRLDE